MFNFNLIPVVLKNIVIKILLVGVNGRSHSAKTKGPIVPKELSIGTKSIASCIGRKVIGGVGEEGHVEKLTSEIARVGIFIKEIEHTEFAYRETESSGIDLGTELHGV